MRGSMSAFLDGWRKAGGPDLPTFIGGVIGIVVRTAWQTAVVVMTLRVMGVL